MLDSDGYTVWTYVPDDGSPAVLAWNPTPGAYLPDSITLDSGVTANLSQSSGAFKGPGYVVPGDMMTVVPWTPPPPVVGEQTSVNLGWPGMTEVT